MVLRTLARSAHSFMFDSAAGSWSAVVCISEMAHCGGLIDDQTGKHFPHLILTRMLWEAY